MINKDSITDLFFDLDHTLWDFETNSQHTFASILAPYAFPFTVEKFMDGRVPERIRARALRAFWKTNPVLANIDGLDEYCDDYTDAAMVIENLQTIYEVGKGYAEQALDALESLADDEEPADQLAGSEIAAQTEDGIEYDKTAETEESGNELDTRGQEEAHQSQPELLEEDPPTEVVTNAPRPRRMHFD